ncbi:MAG TPA: TadE family protein [Beutenbergiaceae bacterium]|nr:TadE family protein [Beutenbergiaceae bacterium]
MSRNQTGTESGGVTAEFAIGLPGVILIILVILGALLAGTTHIQCQEAARIGAREAMLHGDSAHAQPAAAKVVGSSATITVTTTDHWVEVGVTKPVFIAAIPIRVSAHMSAPLEGKNHDGTSSRTRLGNDP